jgi:osmotically inducible lipoprotein OsmB
MQCKRPLALASLTLLLTACGNSSGDRAVSGAGLGAATGAGVAALTGGGVWTGAAIGAAAGAITGAVTNKDQINMGKPVWR